MSHALAAAAVARAEGDDVTVDEAHRPDHHEIASAEIPAVDPETVETLSAGDVVGDDFQLELKG